MMDLPCLDTKTYKKILEESIGRIPSVTNQWTDFNPQDTGILLLEMMAGLTEQLNYMLDQAGEDFRTAARAATAEDFEALALASPFQISQAYACCNGRTVRLVIFRKEGALSQEELQAFSEYMELRCLLGIQLEISQAPKIKANVDLQIQRHPHIRPSLLRRNIARTIEKALQEKPLEKPLDEDALTEELLKIPGVQQVQDLQIHWETEDTVYFAGAMMGAKAETETVTITFD